MYDADVGLLVTEGVLTEDGMPRPRGELRALIANAVFVTSKLERLIDKYDLVTTLRGASKAATVMQVRDLIDIQVWQDYFMGFRSRSDPPRSARVSISFSAPEPELALKIARELGEMVVESQKASQYDAAMARVEALRMLADRASSRATKAKEKFERESEESLLRPDVRWEVRRRQLSSEVRTAEDAAKSASIDLFNAELQAKDARRAGSLVQVVDPGLPFWNTVSWERRLVRQVVLALSLAVFLAVILVGAFDPTVRDEQDLRRAGLAVLGVAPVSSSDTSPVPDGRV
jgi:hypothetical protein